MARRINTSEITDAEVDNSEAAVENSLESPEASIRKVVLQGVMVNRDTGRKDKDGHPIVTRHRPEIGKVFAFTREEYADLKGTGAVRDPKNEDEDSGPVATPELPGAAGDRRSVEHAASVGKHRLPRAESSVPDEEATDGVADEDDISDL